MNNYSDHNVDNTNYNEAFQKQFRNPDFKFDKQSAGEMLAGLMLLGDFGTYAGENLYVSNGTWLGQNGLRYRMGWGGNQYAGARSTATSRAAGFRAAGRVSFAYTLLTESGDLFLGNSYQSSNAAFNVFMGGVATFGGIPGLAIGGFYFFGQTEPYQGPRKIINPFVQDNTYINPYTRRRFP